jgi:hypothetical protein
LPETLKPYAVSYQQRAFLVSPSPGKESESKTCRNMGRVLNSFIQAMKQKPAEELRNRSHIQRLGEGRWEGLIRRWLRLSRAPLYLDHCSIIGANGERLAWRKPHQELDLSSSALCLSASILIEKKLCLRKSK